MWFRKKKSNKAQIVSEIRLEWGLEGLKTLESLYATGVLNAEQQSANKVTLKRNIHFIAADTKGQTTQTTKSEQSRRPFWGIIEKCISITLYTRSELFYLGNSKYFWLGFCCCFGCLFQHYSPHSTNISGLWDSISCRVNVKQTVIIKLIWGHLV